MAQERGGQLETVFQDGTNIQADPKAAGANQKGAPAEAMGHKVLNSL